LAATMPNASAPFRAAALQQIGSRASLGRECANKGRDGCRQRLGGLLGSGAKYGRSQERQTAQHQYHHRSRHGPWTNSDLAVSYRWCSNRREPGNPFQR